MVGASVKGCKQGRTNWIAICVVYFSRFPMSPHTCIPRLLLGSHLSALPSQALLSRLMHRQQGFRQGHCNTRDATTL